MSFGKESPDPAPLASHCDFWTAGGGLQTDRVLKTWESSARSSYMVEEKQVGGTWESWRGCSASAGGYVWKILGAL